jgi:hypothetical protein
MQSKGEIFQWFVNSSGLNQREIDAIAERTQMAFDLLVADCVNGNLKLDLDPSRFLNGTQENKPMKEHACQP